jgi:hypothetical protein
VIRTRDLLFWRRTRWPLFHADIRYFKVEASLKTIKIIFQANYRDKSKDLLVRRCKIANNEYTDEQAILSLTTVRCLQLLTDFLETDMNKWIKNYRRNCRE